LTWSIEYDPEALKDLKKFDRAIQRKILDYMDNRIAAAGSPRNLGNLFETASLDCGGIVCANYRVICELRDKRLVVLVVAVGHRRTIYDK
jgi:mRNA interferase RelE/StbE